MIIDMFTVICFIIIVFFILLLLLLYDVLKEWWNQKKLEKCRYNFDNSYVGPYTFRGKKVFIIDNETAATEAGDILRHQKILYVDCEGDKFGSQDSVLCIVQIATDKNCCYIFDVATCPESLLVLKELFESEDILKIFHDCSGDVAALQEATGNHTSIRSYRIWLKHGKVRICTRNVGDTQVAYKVMHGHCYSLADLYSFECKKNFPEVRVPSYGTENKWICHRPLTEDMIKYAAIDVLIMPEIYQKQIKNVSKSLLMSKYKAAVEERKICKIKKASCIIF